MQARRIEKIFLTVAKDLAMDAGSHRSSWRGKGMFIHSFLLILACPSRQSVLRIPPPGIHIGPSAALQSWQHPHIFL